MANTYYASVRESDAGANKRHLSVFNASGSGKEMVVYRIVAAGMPTTAVTGLKIGLVAVRLSAAPTGGTALAFAKANSANPAVPAQVTAVGGATGGGGVEAVAFGVGAVSGEETASDNESSLYEAPIDGSQQITLPEGEGFEVRQSTLASAGQVTIVCVIGLL
jgi:hypothetical protein